jgi:asparagine synthase (glutamine-hydrolysing)
MCGIAGIVDLGNSPDSRDIMARMTGFLHHRGPDAAGMYANGPAVLGHTRLSIIDLSGGDQPIHNEDRTLWVVFNGEIFNYPELGEELVRCGHRFYTKSDTEILIHAYEQYGPQMLQRLNGQFAFAIWDQNRQSLFLARDRVGIRPLFYHRNGGRLMFASEIKAIFADTQIPRAINLKTLGDVFTCWAPLGEQTALKGSTRCHPDAMPSFQGKGLILPATGSRSSNKPIPGSGLWRIGSRSSRRFCWIQPGFGCGLTCRWALI